MGIEPAHIMLDVTTLPHDGLKTDFRKEVQLIFLYFIYINIGEVKEAEEDLN